MKVFGDVMRPAMSDIGSLLRMPYGCGEQIMITIAPTLKYLRATIQDQPNVRAKAIRYLKSERSFLYSVCLKKLCFIILLISVVP